MINFLKHILSFFLGELKDLITQQDSEVLRKQNIEVLCEWFHLLNGYEQIPELGLIVDDKKYNRHNKRIQLMWFIYEVIGQRIIAFSRSKLTAYHYNNESMTESEFEDYFQNSAEIHRNYEGISITYYPNKKDNEEYRNRQMERYKEKNAVTVKHEAAYVKQSFSSKQQFDRMKSDALDYLNTIPYPSNFYVGGLSEFIKTVIKEKQFVSN